MKEIEQLCVKSLEQLTLGNWQDAVNHCNKIAEEFWRRGGIIEERVGELIISLSSDTDSDMGSECDDELSEQSEQVEAASVSDVLNVLNSLHGK